MGKYAKYGSSLSGGKYAKYANPEYQEAEQVDSAPRKLSTFEKILNPLSYPNYAVAGAITGDVKKAFQERITPGKLVSEQLPENTSAWIKKLLEFVTDVVTDPTTYITLGTNSVVKGLAKEGVEAGAKGLAKSGGKAVTVKFAGQTIAKSEKAYQALKGAEEIAKKTPLIREILQKTKPAMRFKDKYNNIKPGLGDELFDIIRIETSAKNQGIRAETDIAKSFDKRIKNAAKKYGLSDNESKTIISELIEDKRRLFSTLPKNATEAEMRTIADQILKGEEVEIKTRRKTITSFEKSPEVSQIVDDMKETLQTYLKKEIDAGYPVTALDDETTDYLTRVAIKHFGKKDKATASHIARIFREGGSTVEINEFLKSKGYPGNMFLVDPAFVLGVRGNRHARLMHNRQMLDRLMLAAKEAGTDILDPADAKKLFDEGQTLYIARKDWFSTIGKELPPSAATKMANEILIPVSKTAKFTELPEGVSKFYKADEDMYLQLTGLYKRSAHPDQIKDFQNMFDVVQDTWKAWTLGIFPAYHARNFVSNKWNNFLANVWNPKYYGQARKLQAGMKAGKLNPQELALINKAQELGVLNTGWYGGDIPDELLQNFMQGTGRFLQKTIGKENPMVKFGNKFGTMIENNDRLAHFLSKIGEGLTPEEASLSVKKYLFDYTELTNFEKDVLKRVFPFYTWSRKNIPLQIENIIKQPGKYAAIVKAKNAIESGDVGRPNELYMSDWMQRNAPVYIKTDPKTGNSLYFLMGSWIAAADLLKIGNSLTEIVSMITPLFRVPAEVLIPGGGYSFVFDQKIENVPGESSEFLGKLMRKKQIHILKSIRLLNEIDKFMKPQTPHKLDLPMSTKITRFMTGIKLYPYNEEKSRLYWERDIINRINQLKSTITRGYKIGESTEELQKYYQQIEKEQSKLSQ